MTPEELLKPRYKVIEPDTSGRWAVGDIYTFDREVAQSYDNWINQKGEEISFNFFSVFPHLFKRLEWHEYRKEEDMPKYFKYKNTGKVYKATGYNTDGFNIDGHNWNLFYYKNSLPATKEEYENQKQPT